MEKQNIGIHERAGCQVPPIADWAKDQNSGGSLRIVSGLAENTNSIICDGSSELETANGCLVLHGMQGPPAVRRARALQRISIIATRALVSAPKELAFSLDRCPPGMSAIRNVWSAAVLQAKR